MAEKKLSKKALNKSFRNWYYGHLTCFSQEHMQTFGYLCAMLPLVEELYETKEEQKKAMDTYTAFFNTEPQVGSVIVGITAGLEEARANGNEDVVFCNLFLILFPTESPFHLAQLQNQVLPVSYC